MEEQMNALNNFVTEWKAGKHQNDDILVLGFKIIRKNIIQVFNESSLIAFYLSAQHQLFRIPTHCQIRYCSNFIGIQLCRQA